MKKKKPIDNTKQRYGIAFRAEDLERVTKIRNTYEVNVTGAVRLALKHLADGIRGGK